MAQWLERRGLTLRLRISGGRARYVRLTLVERKGLLGGWFNVREARAEASADPEAVPSALGDGRMLSWRPTPQSQAEASMQDRRRTLERLGYVTIAASEHAAEPWAWIRDLVHRQLGADAKGSDRNASEPGPGSTHNRASAGPDDSLQVDEPMASEPAQDTGVHPLLEPVLAGVAGDLDALVEGFATTAGLSVEAFRNPSPANLALVNPEALGPILDALAESEAPSLRALCRAWLDLPTTAYELDAPVLERWLEQGRMPAQRLALRIPAEGLALLGSEALARLSRRSRSPRVRQFARVWTRRVI